MCRSTFFFLNVNDSELCVMAHTIKENPFTSPNVSRVITSLYTVYYLCFWDYHEM